MSEGSLKVSKEDGILNTIPNILLSQVYINFSWAVAEAEARRQGLEACAEEFRF